MIRRRGFAAAAGIAVAACATLRGGGASRCEAVSGALGADASTAAMAGRFRLTLVATSGPATGRVAAGALDLRFQDSALVPLPMPGLEPAFWPTQPLVGTAIIALEDVGAVRMGDLLAADPRAPGVAVLLERPGAGGAPSIVLRLGSEANRRGVLRFDGGYTILRVRRIASDGVWGVWESGAGEGPGRDAAGHFCAERRR